MKTIQYKDMGARIRAQRESGAGTFGRFVFRRNGRICGNHGGIRFGEDHAAEYTRSPRPADQRQENIIFQGKRIEQVEILKYKAQIIPPERCNFPFLDHRQIFSIQKNLSAGRLVEGCEYIQQRGLPRKRWNCG